MAYLNKLPDYYQFTFYDSLRGQVLKGDYYSTSIAIAYAYYTHFKHFGDDAFNFELDVVLSLIEDFEIRAFVTRMLTGINFSKANSNMIFGREGQIEYILNAENNVSYSAYSETPKSILDISHRILSINDGENVLSSGLDLGNFICNESTHNKRINYTFTGINEDIIAIVKIKLEILKSLKGYENINSITLKKPFLGLDLNKQIDKAFINMPFNVKQDYYIYDEFKETTPILKAFKKPNRMDWPYMLKVVQLLKEGGKAVSLSFVGTTYNLLDREFRKYFVDKGLIEAVIALPEKLLSISNIPTILYVFSHNNKSIKFIDATEIYEAGRRENILNEDNINTIMSAYLNETEGISKNISIGEIAENDYALIPVRYFSSITYTNGVALKDLITIRRGASIRADELDKISTIDHTDYQYLMLADINDGIISDDLHFITHIDDSLSNFVLNEKNIVLSKIGTPFKVAIMDERETKILANGNLYILEADESKVDPYYLQAFLQSDEGQNLLASVGTGASFASISIKDLSELKIPLPSLEEQKVKGKIYKETLNDIITLTNKVEKAKNKIAILFNKH